MIIFIMDSSIDCLVFKSSENSEKCRCNYPEPKVTHSQYLFWPTNSKNVKNNN